jgi:hypothetical protein
MKVVSASGRSPELPPVASTSLIIPLAPWVTPSGEGSRQNMMYLPVGRFPLTWLWPPGSTVPMAMYSTNGGGPPAGGLPEASAVTAACTSAIGTPSFGWASAAKCGSFPTFSRVIETRPALTVAGTSKA